MMSLDHARDWFLKAKKQLDLLNRIGRRHWSGLSWDESIGRDERIRSIESQDIVDDTDFCLDHLNDFANLILFSAFESIIRDRVRLDVQNERKRLDHPLLRRILEKAVQEIELGSIFRVLDVFKAQDAHLVEEVNQVRRYRNWVVDGRRGQPPSGVDPEIAYVRSKRFLGQFTEPLPEEP